jgi:CheY-like chemotaxis protein
MTPKLLLADDSITVQRVIALTFQGEGIDVIAVGDGDQAVAAIDRERPQIVLADLSMPGRDGYAVAEYVKQSPDLAKSTRVVLLTGAAEPVEEARSRALGIDGVLSKPFEPHVATALVRRLLSEAPTQPAAAGAPAEPPPVPAAAEAKAGGSMAGDAIAVDDYFRRLDEALATAGLGTAPETAGDLAATAGLPVAEPEASTDAETMVIARPVAARAEPEADDADAPKLVDAFSALLAAEEGGGVVAGPVEMEGAPAPVPPPAVEWTPGGAPAPVEAAAETVMLQAVEVAELERAAASPAAAVGDAAAAEPEPAADEAAATVMLAAPVASSPSPVALRADVAEPSALDGVDLDVFADAVAQKILHRLTDARIDAIVSERVLEIAERLVREEIERIKADAQ